MYRICAIIFLTVGFALAGCGKFEFSPNQVTDHDSPRHINQTNIARLMAQHPDDTVRLILTGDSQRSYDNIDEFVKKANQVQGLDFVLLDGDISDFGLFQEFEWVDDMYQKLNVPYIGIIGNHDFQGNGEKIFEKMYGDFNFSFTYAGYKFVCHNTNSREHSYDGTVPDLAWLKKEFADTNVKGTIAVAHVPPFSVDFDPKYEDAYADILNTSGKLSCALYAHVGNTGIYHPYEQDAPYITTGGLDNRQFMVIEITNGKVSTQTVKY